MSHLAPPELVALIGPPGAGKTTALARLDVRDAVVVGLDRARAEVSCCAADQSATHAAVRRSLATARAALAAGTSVVWDATNARRRERRRLLDLAREQGARTRAVVVLPDLGTALARNATRDPSPCPACGHAERVPDDVVRRMHATISRAVPDLPAEGWDRVDHLDPT
ncbi:ATP-binding protein [Saccharopolyspora cebuensis]|uniref:AAA family ATPase n=1 Tax=Saccharopolyspora cebuensis TaxID=418759 RepID=A0ABV4CF91_9PSEU